LRARVKKRQTVKRLEIIAIVAVVVVSLVVGFYYALMNNSDPLDGSHVPLSVYDSLYQASVTQYGASGSSYLGSVHNMTGPVYSSNGKPILVFVGANYCEFCAVQRWSLIMALMRFGSFTTLITSNGNVSSLEYMHSSAADFNYATFTLSASSYHSNYLVFQPFEVYDRSGNTIATLPANYTSGFHTQGQASFPFLNFADKYYISGALLQPVILGTKNQTQIIASIEAGDALGTQIKQAANVITAVICKITDNNPSSVCDNPSITSLTSTFVSYSPSSSSGGSDLLLAGVPMSISRSVFTNGRVYRGWN
jgi:uncharacterized protein DUF929